MTDKYDERMYNEGVWVETGERKKKDLNWMKTLGITWSPFGGGRSSPYCNEWWRFVIMHNKAENAICMFWSEISAD